MATIICIDGLAGHPETTFRTLKSELEKAGYEVVVPPMSTVSSHEDRVMIALLSAWQVDGDVFFVGQSAGGSAVRVAAEMLEEKNKPIKGVILLSPAMPRGILFMTITLFKVMVGRIFEILFGKNILPTEEEYQKLVSPLSEETKTEIISSRQRVSSKEARNLVFCPPKFVGYSAPTLLVFGTEDRWIARKAQYKLAKLFKIGQISMHEIEGAGHLTLASEKRTQVIDMIVAWVKFQSKSS